MEREWKSAWDPNLEGTPTWYDELYTGIYDKNELLKLNNMLRRFIENINKKFINLADMFRPGGITFYNNNINLKNDQIKKYIEKSILNNEGYQESELDDILHHNQKFLDLTRELFLKDFNRFYKSESNTLNCEFYRNKLIADRIIGTIQYMMGSREVNLYRNVLNFYGKRHVLNSLIEGAIRRGGIQPQMAALLIDTNDIHQEQYNRETIPISVANTIKILASIIVILRDDIEKTKIYREVSIYQKYESALEKYLKVKILELFVNLFIDIIYYQRNFTPYGKDEDDEEFEYYNEYIESLENELATTFNYYLEDFFAESEYPEDEEEEF